MPYSRRNRVERRIAIGRALLATFFVGVVWLDPVERIHYNLAVYTLFGVYAVYAVALALMLRRTAVYSRRLPAIGQTVDIIVFSAFIYFTNGPTSLFFVFFVFVLIAAALRWQWRGVVVSGLACLGAFLVLEVVSAFAQLYGEFGYGELIIGIVYLGVLGWLLAFLVRHEEKLHTEVGQLAVWSRDTASRASGDAGRSGMLSHAASTMGVPRVVLVWEDDDEPHLHVESWEHGHTTLSSAAPSEYSPLVREDLDGVAFLCSDVLDGSEVVVANGTRHDTPLHGDVPVHSALADRYGMKQVVSAPVHLVDGKGRLFFLDKTEMSSDDLELATIVAAGVRLIVDESRLEARLRAAAAYEERVRLARDLHDGVLQSLTATALQLERARRLYAQGSPAAREVAEAAQQSLARDQRDLRLFVDQLKPLYTTEIVTALDLRARLLQLREKISRQRGLDAEIVFEDLAALTTVSDQLAADAYFIVNEALTNAARHGRARRAWVTVRFKADTLEIEIRDDGSGFPFTGHYDMDSLRTTGMGPVTLMHRAATRGGTLMIDSSSAGSRVEIILPHEIGSETTLEDSRAGVL